jgi:hypothetical protein
MQVARKTVSMLALCVNQFRLLAFATLYAGLSMDTRGSLSIRWTPYKIAR